MKFFSHSYPFFFPCVNFVFIVIFILRIEKRKRERSVFINHQPKNFYPNSTIQEMNFISRISERLRLIFYARPLRGGSLKKLYNTYNLRRPTAMLGP